MTQRSIRPRASCGIHRSLPRSVAAETACIQAPQALSRPPGSGVIRVYQLLSKELGVDPEAHLKEAGVPEDTEEEEMRRKMMIARSSV